MNTESPQSGLPLAKPSTQSSAIPNRRLTDTEKALIIVNKLIQANDHRDQMRAKIHGLIDGNPPFSAAKLKQQAQLWRCNVNWGEAKAAISTALTPYYDLFSGSEHYVMIRTDYGDPFKRIEWSRAIEEEANAMLKAYDAFDHYFQQMIHDVVVDGRGFMIWPDKTDWKFRCLMQRDVLVPDSTEALLSNLQLLVVRRSYPIDELTKYLRSASSEATGWNKKELTRAIADAVPKNTSGATIDYQLQQQQIKDMDMMEGVTIDEIKAAELYVREFDGTVSHLIVCEKGNPKEFLYASYNKYKAYNEIFAAFFLETLDGSWNGATGLGKEIYPAMEAKNRLRCAMVDTAFLRTGITMQAKDANAIAKTSLVQIGAFNIIPPGYEVQQSQIFGDLQASMAVNNDLDAMLQNNTGVYRPRLDKPQGNPRTAKEVELAYQTQAILGNSAVNRFYLNLDRFYMELIRRMKNDEEFRKRCKDRGVPEQAIEKINKVRAYRVAGNGSMYMRQQAIQDMMPFITMLPEAGRVNFLRDAIAVILNQEMVERYYPIEQQDPKEMDQRWDANIENVAMHMGQPVLITPTQDSVTHAQVHLQGASEAAQAIQQGADGAGVLAFIGMVINHVPEHLALIAQDQSRKDILKVLSEQLKQLIDFANGLEDQLNKQVQAQQEAQAQEQQAAAIQQGTDPETQVKIAIANRDMQIKEAKAQQALKQKDEKHKQQMALADAKTAVGIKLAAAKAKAKPEKAKE